MKIDLSTNEIIDLLLDGSTNQKQFMEDIRKSGNSYCEVISQLEHIDEDGELNFDLRGDINGGVLRFEKLTEEIIDNYYYVRFVNGYGLVFY